MAMENFNHHEDLQEVWWIKDALNRLQEKISPYWNVNKEFNDLQDFIYKKSWENGNLLDKTGSISYVNDKWEIWTLSMLKHSWWTPLKVKRTISVNEWGKVLKLNCSSTNFKESDGLWWSKHFYLTNDKEEIIEDRLTPEQVTKELEYIKSKKSLYENATNKRIEGYKN